METSWFKDKIVLCGPFVGSFGEEIFSFRPFVYWLKENFDFPNIIISTHYNRSFLYEDGVIPIFRQYTKNEKNQEKHRHKKINAKDYQYLTNDIKDQISKVSNFNKGDIIVYNLGYMSLPNISYRQKRFVPLNGVDKNRNTILYIPEKSRTDEEHKKIWERLKDLYDVEVTGDMSTRLHDCNKLFDTTDYHDRVYKEIVDKILSAKIVITPSSHWTFFCNLHSIPVFSWGNNISQYKDTFNFGNKCTIVPFDRGNNVDKLLKSIDKFVKENE